jgi:hypothetical protein
VCRGRKAGGRGQVDRCEGVGRLVGGGRKTGERGRKTGGRGRKTGWRGQEDWLAGKKSVRWQKGLVCGADRLVGGGRKKHYNPRHGSQGAISRTDEESHDSHGACRLPG